MSFFHPVNVSSLDMQIENGKVTDYRTTVSRPDRIVGAGTAEGARIVAEDLRTRTEPGNIKGDCRRSPGGIFQQP